jgi:hypothetical protein
MQTKPKHRRSKVAAEDGNEMHEDGDDDVDNDLLLDYDELHDEHDILQQTSTM